MLVWEFKPPLVLLKLYHIVDDEDDDDYDDDDEGGDDDMPYEGFLAKTMIGSRWCHIFKIHKCIDIYYVCFKKELYSNT